MTTVIHVWTNDQKRYIVHSLNTVVHTFEIFLHSQLATFIKKKMGRNRNKRCYGYGNTNA